MHAVSHSLAHRASSATRTKARWQPYTALVSSSLPPRSPHPYLATPPPSVSSSPPSTHLCENDRPSSSAYNLPIRDVQKTRYVITLIDQAVKTLCEIWQPQDIPHVFLTSSCASVVIPPKEFPVPSPLASQKRLLDGLNQNTQLPSPISPTSNQRPISPPSTSSQSGDARASTDVRSTILPLRGFIHELLRRSRTSSAVLQTALCYLEAIRLKVPELVRLEKLGLGVRGEQDSSDRIILLDEYDMDIERDLQVAFESMINVDKCAPTPISLGDESTKTGDIGPPPSERKVGFQDSEDQPTLDRGRKGPSPPLPPLPPLPSPLLCPRRAFLASLILASKFTQDRCYSNRAWAKLSGLPPREIGRCERALGDMLQWRLWVGKKMPTQSSANGRAVVRCRSEGDLSPESKVSSSLGWRPDQDMGCSSKADGLKRRSTLPADAFSATETSISRPDTVILQRSTLSAPECPYPARYVTSRSQGLNYLASSMPPTPQLSDSPSSTESDPSEGERTVQISSFVDTPFSPDNLVKSFVTEGDHVSSGQFGLAPVAQPHIVGIDPTLYGWFHPSLRKVTPSVIPPDSFAMAFDAVHVQPG